MAIARSKLVDVSVARWYHCVSRCVHKAFLLGEGDGNRNEWIENRLVVVGIVQPYGDHQIKDEWAQRRALCGQRPAEVTEIGPARAGRAQHWVGPPAVGRSRTVTQPLARRRRHRVL
jgi:hypothetical protein